MLDLLLRDSLPPDLEALAAINNFTDRVLRFYYLKEEKEVVLDEDELVQVAEIALKFLLNFKGPSGFKVAAAFIVALASRKPFKTPLPKSFDPIRAEQNIALGIMESLYWL